jgi:hypothetical protein
VNGRPWVAPSVAELRLNHLALFGNPQAAVDRARRLRLQREIHRSAAAADAAAAAVEQRQVRPRVAADANECFLRAVQLPIRRQPAAVLR